MDEPRTAGRNETGSCGFVVCIRKHDGSLTLHYLAIKSARKRRNRPCPLAVKEEEPEEASVQEEAPGSLDTKSEGDVSEEATNLEPGGNPNEGRATSASPAQVDAKEVGNQSEITDSAPSLNRLMESSVFRTRR